MDNPHRFCLHRSYMKNILNHIAAIMESAGGGCPLPTTSTTEALQSLGATIDFIGCWIKSLEHNFLELCNLYTHYMEELFQKIPVELPN